MNNTVTFSLATILTTAEPIRDSNKTDQDYQAVLEKVKNHSFHHSVHLESPTVKCFHRVKDRLSIHDGCLMYTFEINLPRLSFLRNYKTKLYRTSMQLT